MRASYNLEFLPGGPLPCREGPYPHRTAHLRPATHVCPTDTPRSHGGDKAKVSGRRSWLSQTLSYSDDPAPRGTLSPVGSIFNLLTVPRAEPQGSSQAQRQPHWLAPTPSFASCTPIGCFWKDFKIASGFRLARRPSFCSAVLTMSSTNTFSFITYGKELYPPFPSLLLCKNCDTREGASMFATQLTKERRVLRSQESVCTTGHASG